MKIKCILLSLAFLFFMGTTVHAKTREWTPDGGQWLDGIGNIYYMEKYTFGATVIKNKVYYASYSNSSQKKMTMCSCKLNGSSRKKLFTLTGKGDYCQVLVSEVNEEAITVYVSGGDNSGTYVYNMKTKKLEKA